MTRKNEWHRPWRYGSIHECELDSLADRLLTDERLRHMLEGTETWDVGRDRWRTRVAVLARESGTTYADQLAAVVERATEHVAESPHPYVASADASSRTCRLCRRGANAELHRTGGS